MLFWIVWETLVYLEDETMEKVSKMKLENELQKALTIEFVRNYCIENNISVDKLKNERFYLSYSECGFAHPSGVKPDGLRNDMETIPKITLAVKHEDDKLSIEQTEFTKIFLRDE